MATTYVQVGDSCYANGTAATNAMAALSTGQIVPGANGSANRVVVSSYTPTNLKYEQFDIVTGASVGSSIVMFSPPPCSKLDVADTLTLCWMVIAVWTVAFGFAMMKRAT